MNEWRREMPAMISEVDDEDLEAAFARAATETIWKTHKEPGGIFPSYYVIRIRGGELDTRAPSKYGATPVRAIAGFPLR